MTKCHLLKCVFLLPSESKGLGEAIKARWVRKRQEKNSRQGQGLNQGEEAEWGVPRPNPESDAQGYCPSVSSVALPPLGRARIRRASSPPASPRLSLPDQPPLFPILDV